MSAEPRWAPPSIAPGVTAVEVLVRAAVLLDCAVDRNVSRLAKQHIVATIRAAVRALCPELSHDHLIEVADDVFDLFLRWQHTVPDLDRHLPQATKLSSWALVPRRTTVQLSLLTAAYYWRAEWAVAS
jgi:hypothetical protein